MINSIGSLLFKAKIELSCTSESARHDAEALLSFVTGRAISYFYTWPDKILDDLKLRQFYQLLARRKKGEPIAYLVGKKEFWSHFLRVTKDTFIPRPDTEVLVESVLLFDPGENNRIPILELGTGSGAIAIAVASEKAEWQITAVDISSEALKIAEENANFHRCNNIEFVRSDWFSSLSTGKRFDVIVSNPPYIAENDPDLCQYVRYYEPIDALISDKNGLADIEFIIKESRNFLSIGGLLCLEHGYRQANVVTQMYIKYGYDNINTILDLSGHTRVTTAYFNADRYL
jgi:release factor glutamine methyltransferase